MEIGYKLYEDYRDTNKEDFEKLQLQMALECEANGWCMEDGYDEDGRRYLIINPPDMPNLDELKQVKKDEFKSIRDNREVAPIEYKGNLFDYDSKARDRINSAIIALDLSRESIEWTTYDNKNVLITSNDLRLIIANVAVRSNELHVRYRLLKEKIDACTSEEELEFIAFDMDLGK